ncbi:N-acetyltransferase [Filobacillus milosensis]|uniref:N-acetyltransferase n=1 Tax=Filobacillus milosensis TaxID=94137 RepID=A0A4Y8IR00_9BACI|nr:GNAT family N-acetyltransferase [Filobacillus milosensis]TFB22894.1 N-acetyltransferase [Filobacillus milosensis]
MDISNLVIETERLILRPYIEEDYEKWYESYDQRKPSQYKYDEGRPKDLSGSTRSWFVKWIKGFEESAKQDKMYILAIFRKNDGANLGKVELVTILRMDYQWAMMGYSLHNQFWGQGYGTESVIAGRDAFFKHLDFHRIELHINPDNQPSLKLAERAGFQFECKRIDFSLENDEWVDYLIFYKNRD